VHLAELAVVNWHDAHAAAVEGKRDLDQLRVVQL
jgi:hypothetical protein